jgi:DnaJ-class molecular chaperone
VNDPVKQKVLDSFKQIGARPVIPSQTVTCYVCMGLGSDDNGRCQQCHGTGLLWTNGGGR